MKIFKNFGIALLFAGLFTSCMSPITEKDNGRTFELAMESPFEINLVAEQGMAWEVVNYNKSLIKPPQIEVTETTDNSGQPVKEYSFSFETHGSGQSLVTLVYFEENDSTNFPHKTFEVELIFGTMGQIESD